MRWFYCQSVASHWNFVNYHSFRIQKLSLILFAYAHSGEQLYSIYIQISFSSANESRLKLRDFFYLLSLFSSFLYDCVRFLYSNVCVRCVHQYTWQCATISVIFEFLIQMECIVCVFLYALPECVSSILLIIYAWFPSLIYVRHKRKHFIDDDENNDDDDNNTKNVKLSWNLLST